MAKQRIIELPAYDRLHSLFEVAPVSTIGVDSGLIWRYSPRPGTPAGAVAGTKAPNTKQDGRFDWRVGIDLKKYLVSRIIYKMVHKVDPMDLTIDHVDGDSQNNNASNLVLASRHHQGLNQRLRSDNTSGVRGVSGSRYGWVAQIGINGAIVRIGCFSCKKKAAAAYNEALYERCQLRYERLHNKIDSICCDCSTCFAGPIIQEH